MDKTKIVLVGKGGSGIDHARKLLELAGFESEISTTTRPPRVGEVGGVTYHYTTDNDMLRRVLNDEFIQACYHKNGHTYGTCKEQFEEKNLFIMTPMGLEKLNNYHRKQCFVIYFAIPSNVRKKRLSLRQNADNCAKRMKDDEKDFFGFVDFDLMITDPNFTIGDITNELPDSLLKQVGSINNI